MTLVVFVVFLLLVPLKLSSCGCKQTYSTICETIADFEALEYKKPDVIIESLYIEDPPKRAIKLSLFQELLTLTIVGQIKEILPIGDTCFTNSRLKFVNLYNNDVKQLKSNTFPYISKINKLSLVNNRIESIEPLTFAGCQPEIIDLSNNKIENIETHTFTSPWANTNSTKVIFMENNRLVNIEVDSFPSSLKFLNLYNNSLRFIEEDVFENVKDLQILLLGNNKFSRLPDTRLLERLTILDLAYNRISRLNGEAFGLKEALKTLDLSHNKISVIRNNTFLKFKILSKLDLSHNQIQNLDFLHPLYDNWLKVSLAFNHLDHISFNVEENQTLSQFSLSLFGNPWRCSTWMSIERYLIKKNIQRDDCDLELFGTGQNPFCFCQYEDACPSFINGSRGHLQLHPRDEILEKRMSTSIKNGNSLKQCGIIAEKQRYRDILFSSEPILTMCS